jgi:hypothetical protein
MKKAVILTMALVLLSVTAFATDPSWSCWGLSELKLISGNSNTDDISSFWGTDWWSNDYNRGGPHMGFNFSFSNDTFGYYLSFQWQNWDIFGDQEYMSDEDEDGDPDTSDALGSDGNGAKVYNCYGSTKIIPDLLSAKIGLISEDKYNYNPPAAGDWAGKKNADIYMKPGLELTLEPPDMGLKVMAFYHVPLDPYINNPVDWAVGPNSGTNGDTLEYCFKTSDVIAQYTIPGTASFTAGTLGINNQTGWKADPGRPIFATIKTFMIPNLNLDLSVQYNLPDPDLDWAVSSLSVILGATYTIDALVIKASGWIFDKMADDPEISYRTGLYLEYTVSDYWLALQTQYTYDYAQDWGDDDGDGDSAEIKDTGDLEIMPWVKHNPSGVQLGLYLKYNLFSEYLEWAIPLQISFGF